MCLKFFIRYIYQCEIIKFSEFYTQYVKNNEIIYFVKKLRFSRDFVFGFFVGTYRVRECQFRSQAPIRIFSRVYTRACETRSSLDEKFLLSSGNFYPTACTSPRELFSVS